LFLNFVFNHQLAQLAGADAGILCRLIYFPIVAKEQFFEILLFKIFDGLPPGGAAASGRCALFGNESG
jgi:hypothetical protein